MWQRTNKAALHSTGSGLERKDSIPVSNSKKCIKDWKIKCVNHFLLTDRFLCDVTSLCGECKRGLENRWGEKKENEELFFVPYCTHYKQ